MAGSLLLIFSRPVCDEFISEMPAMTDTSLDPNDHDRQLNAIINRYYEAVESGEAPYGS